ncbi:hypothetical protein HMPREF3171_01000 [Corynebacterium sp. HMSC08F01]|uniref:hypothetical protein n=1 Tax=Corynebacterium TaxID=1716 RepID=UPI0008A4A93D|nr:MULTISPECIES: hypothetical protein [Corynebacterium]MDK8241565.1 hypothetical protein [Corynebacterium coyleae]OFL15312.1 hypothetical protein HMPREF2785_11065 [Corynebacterium sp. HMSC067D03]OFO36939.1 hypothetical protein HMPREF3048_04645 [Corynebacterium sp. HMSC075D04]OFT32008.1 hypothetical protein HMPREF3171_01000 [Corynebacterium sp. HMSC08F01]OFU51944.1 hypothetical protein HMPREF3120_10660 [Corynebacterium sp. HMSC11D10]
MRKFALCLTTITCTAALTACGGATVDSEDVTETAATSATETATSATESGTASATESATASSAAAPGSSSRNGAGDQPAREVETVPTQVPSYAPEEQAFLDHLRQNGVNVDGLEDQLTATGFTVCDDDTITRDAVAGQLVEQRRTDMDAGTVATLLSDTARANLCG